MTRRGVLTAMAAAGVVGTVGAGGAGVAAALTPSVPFTFPALPSWTPGVGSFQISTSPAVVVRADALSVFDSVPIDLANDLSSVLGLTVRSLTNSGNIGTGNIGVVLVPADPSLGSEGYALEVGDALIIRASSRAGAVHGAQTVIQLLAQGSQIPRGCARDWPQYPERGLLVDVARKPTYDAAWLRDRVRELALLKLNRLHLHFTDDAGWRIECSIPGVQSDVCMTKAEVRDLIVYATRYGVTIVPEIDMPGHFTAALRNYPQHQLANLIGQRNAACLDYTSSAARAFAVALVEEYLALFPGPVFHLGGDEYMLQAEIALYPSLSTYAISRYGLGATVKDGYLGFFNDLNAVVRAHGRSSRVWNDYLGGGNKVALDPNITVEWWTDVDPISDVVGVPLPQQLLDAGHAIVNCGWYPTYLNATTPPAAPDIAFTYERWAVTRFHGALYLNADIGTPWYDVAPAQPGLLGTKLSVWGDGNATSTAAADAVAMAPWLRVIAQQSWGSPHLATTYAAFTASSAPIAAVAV